MSRFWNLGALLLGSTLLLAGPSYAEETTGPTETAEAASDPDDVICRRVQVTGTRLRQRICYTRAEWTNMREAGQDTIRRETIQGLQENGEGSTASGGF